MQTVELKLKQARAVLGVPLQGIAELRANFGVLTPRRRERVRFFNANVLL